MLFERLKSGPQPCPAVSAQVKSATPKKGMTKTLTMNIHRRAGTLRKRNGSDASQNIVKLNRSGGVMEELAGSELRFQVLNEGQMASIIHRTALPPRDACTPYQMIQTIARTT